jgi:CRP/FNR family transcriptional regulator, cyclic AMP receptor protein
MRRQRETLARIPLFKDVDERSLARLDTQCTWRLVKAQEWVIDYKQEGTDVFFVPYGHVRVIIQSPSGRDIILRDIRDGEYFGELAAIDGQARSAGIRAVTDTVIAQMPARVFRSAIHQHPQVCDGLLLLLTSEVRRLAHRLKERDVLNGRERLFAELLRLSAPCGENVARISPPPTHAELAARVGVRREVVTRELKLLERQNLIEKKRGAFVILNVCHLESLIQEAE